MKNFTKKAVAILTATFILLPSIAFAFEGNNVTEVISTNINGHQGQTVLTITISEDMAGTSFEAYLTNFTNDMDTVNLAFFADGVLIAFDMFLDEGNIIPFTIPLEAEGSEFTIIASTNSSNNGTLNITIDNNNYESEPSMLVALTFDDGPFNHTYVLLDILAEYDIRATFFVIGEHLQNHPEQARLIFEAGHDIENHSWTHIALGSENLETIHRELTTTSEAIRGVTGEYPVFFRAPFLSYGEYLTQVATEMGMAIIGSDAIGVDWEDITPEQIAENVLNAVQDGSIILLHEQWEAENLRTKLALPIIFAELHARGFEIVSLSELVYRKGLELEAGVLYDAIN